MYISDVSIKRPVFAIVLILGLVTLGILSYFDLSVNEYPEMEFPYVSITIVEPGASAQQIENNISQKVEEAVAQVAGVKHIYTIVREGVSIIWAEFTLETSAPVAAQDIRDKISSVRGQLPADIEEPIIERFDPSAAPIVTIAVTGNGTMKNLTQIVDDKIKEKLTSIDGVGAVNIYGRAEREIQIKLNKEKMAAYGLTTEEVVNSLKGENMDVPVGKLTMAHNQIFLRTEGNLKNIWDFYNLVVGKKDGVLIYVKDIAIVVDGIKEQDSLSSYSGSESIGIDIIKQAKTNTVEIADKIKKTIDKIQKDLPANVKIEVIMDNSINIRNSIEDVIQTIFIGSILAIFVIFVFLKDWRSTLISAITLPTSIITTFFVMKILKFSLNTMSLMALSLSVGMLIDDTIVVIENISRHMSMGKKNMEAAKESMEEIGFAIIATTLSIVAAFLPVGLMDGVIGRFFQQFGITVAFSVLVSTLVALTLTPMLSSRLLKMENLTKNRNIVYRVLDHFNNNFDRLIKVYLSVLRISLRHRIVTMIIAILMFVGSLMTIPHLGSSFITTADIGEFMIAVELDSGLSMDAAERKTLEIEKILNDTPHVIKTYGTIKSDKIDIFVKLNDKNHRELTIEQVIAQLRNKFKEIPGIQSAFNIKAFDTDKKVQIYVLGEDPEVIQRLGEKTVKLMNGIPGAVDVSSSYKPGSPQVNIKIDHEKANDLGISTAQIADTMHTLFSGKVVSKYSSGEDRYDVKLILDDKERKNMSDLENIYLYSTKNEELVSLDQVTNIIFDTTSNELRRFDRKKEVFVSANVDGVSIGEFNKIFFDRLEKEIEIPEGYSIEAKGDAEMMEETFINMLKALVTAVLFIFFILAAQFESFIDPFAIMLSLPLAIIGTILGLLALGSDLSMMSMVGVIMLMGLVTKNAILLIDYIKQQREANIERTEAILKAGNTRFRPIMMTSLSTIFGMIPLGLALGPGAEARAPMAHAIMGGMITSTILTLIVVPVVYTILDDIKGFIMKRFKKSTNIKYIEGVN
ncbi:efflux RND transporter permease subunit [Anaeromicrobium sediminis]|uniref:Acriflavin resistance protein n=1 Tax=Anaeromicrobium sediminis TaxID=1478221 RepID=A0A267MDP2_9FIRM|nr:efflux RND transporter permease subunit [Anaeromicrobium sediminis]PAB56920.1 acriflavin resistance protein [Anaeromicrobium sediminis]